MKIAIIKNAEFEGPGTITEWMELRGHRFKVYNAYQDDLPELGTFDFLIILGSPNSANDELSWIVNEKKLLKAAIENGTFVFGIAFGAHLIAAVLGSRIYQNEQVEIGWSPIKCAHNFLQQEMTVFHWHKETFEIPPGSDLLASSDTCYVQAFAFSDSVLGLQFHLEMDEESIAQKIINHSPAIKQAEYIQSMGQLKNQTNFHANCKEELFDLLDGFEIRFNS